MKLTEIAIKRPLFILMVIFSLLVFGLISYTRMGTDLYPTLKLPIVSVVTVYPGAGPEEVESRVSKPLEDVVIGLGNVKNVTSISAEGVSYVTIEFTDAANENMVATDVERKVNMVRASLPQEAMAPTIVKAEVSMMPVVNLSMVGSRPMDQLYSFANDKVKTKLETVEGVASVQIIGGLEREIAVKVDEGKLKARGLSILQVNNALSQQNMSMPSGNVSDSGKDFNVRLTGLVQSPKELEDLVVSSSPAGTIRLRDVATVEDTFKTVKRLNRTNGIDSIGIVVTKQPTANTVKVAENVRSTLKEMESSLPADIEIKITVDTSEFVKQSLDGVRESLFEAVILTGMVLLLFLHTFRSTLIVLFAIPTSLISTFVVMNVMGFSLNMMSMMGLSLCVGILVDDSIVVLENIFRHLKLGETPWSAAIKGRSEIGLAAIAITLIDVVVYAPVAFMSGFLGSLFREFGLTVAIATLFSLAISFTLTPMLASRWLHTAEETEENAKEGRWARFSVWWERSYDRLTDKYGHLLGWALRHRRTVVTLAAVSFFGSIALVPLGLVTTEYMPTTDQGMFTISVEMPAGSTLDITDKANSRIEAVLTETPEVDTYFTAVGVSGDRTEARARYGRIQVQLVKRSQRARPTSAVMEDIRKKTNSISDAEIRIVEPNNATGAGQPIMIRVKGEEITTLTKIADQLESIVSQTPGTKDVTNSNVAGAPEVRIVVDHQKAADLGLNANQIASALRTGFEGTVVTQLRPDGKNKVDVRVSLKDSNSRAVESIESIPVLSNRGIQVKLSQIARIEQVKGPTEISRQDRQRVISIGANLSERSLGEVSADIQNEAKKISLPEGYHLDFGGATKEMEDSFISLFAALGLSLLLMYILLVALYESMLYPFIIMFSIPVSIVGALIALMITRDSLSLVSMIGLIMLTGLVAKNGILLVDYTNTLRRGGMKRNEAIMEAGPTRLRPILMTTMAMVAAMLPGALKIREGSEMGAPLAVVVIGGLISSMFLTLVLVPVVYTLLDDLQTRLGFVIMRQRTSEPARTTTPETITIGGRKARIGR